MERCCFNVSSKRVYCFLLFVIGLLCLPLDFQQVEVSEHTFQISLELTGLFAILGTWEKLQGVFFEVFNLFSEQFLANLSDEFWQGF